MTALRVFTENAKQTERGLRALFSGLYSYYTRGDADENAWIYFLERHCATNGRSTDRLAQLLRIMRPPRPVASASSLLGTLSPAQIKNIVSSLARDGYYVFENRLPTDVCDEIERFARCTPAIAEGRSSSRADRVLFDHAAPVSKRYFIALEDIVTNQGMQRLMADPLLLSVAEQYLRAHPILCGADMWWSPAFGDTPGEDAAQEFHFDFDGAPVWLKYFVYLTDVTPNNGPHVFVRGSHLANHPSAAALLRRGYVRISDKDISDAFGKEKLIEICGSRGTVLAVDTRGFHKGQRPLAGYRLVAQLFYCCPQFNLHGPRQSLPPTIHPELAAAIKTTPKVFERFPYGYEVGAV
jgi:Phytanoyl-CoA dioxygenase (PhyH)